MPLFTWYNMYSINNEEIDNQHKKLFGIFNMLYDICTGCDRNNSLETIINELILYSSYHFNAEEEYMRNIHYRDINNQISEHDLFERKVLELKVENAEGDSEKCHELVLFLSNWLLDHVIKEDKKISLDTKGGLPK
jgi:hemerythrin